MAYVFLGQIMLFGGTYAPRGFAFCNGQSLSIAQNTALFSLLGTTYGGDGVSTFALPNMQSLLPVGQGTGQGLSTYALGQTGGVPQVTLTSSTTPAHSHALNATTAIATATAIGTSVLLGQPQNAVEPLLYASTVDSTKPVVPQVLDKSACSAIGGNQPHSNLMPSLCISFIIALQGVFPSRS